MKATLQAEHDHNKHARPYDYQQGQMIWLDERNFLSKNRKLSPNWTGPYPITKIKNNGVVTLQKMGKSITVNVDRIKPYVPPVQVLRQNQADEDQETAAEDPPSANQPAPTAESPQTPHQSEQEDSDKDEWTLVTRKKRAKTEHNFARARPDPNYSGRLTRARAAARARAALPMEAAHALVSAVNTEAEKWRKSVIPYSAPASGPLFVSDEFGLPKQQKRIQQPEWVYKRRQFLKKLSVADRNLLLTGDPGFAFDPVAYDILYHYPQQLPAVPLIAQQLGYIPSSSRASSSRASSTNTTIHSLLTSL